MPWTDGSIDGFLTIICDAGRLLEQTALGACWKHHKEPEGPPQSKGADRWSLFLFVFFQTRSHINGHWGFSCLKTVNSIYLSQVSLEFKLVHHCKFPIFYPRRKCFHEGRNFSTFQHRVRLYYSKMCMMCLCACTCMLMHLSVCMWGGGVIARVCVSMLYQAKANTISKTIQLFPRVCSQCIIQQTHKNFKNWILFGVCVCVLLSGSKTKEHYGVFYKKTYHSLIP